MISHYIVMSSAYTEGTRIALDITSNSNILDTALIQAIREYIKKECGEDVPISTHMIQTESDSWDSIPAYDPYFQDVKCVESVQEFASIVKQSRVLSGMDVVMYILTKMKCTHLLLEKMVYFAYADYLCDHSKRLFEDPIYAFRHGPVIKSVYEAYKRSGYRYVDPVDNDKNDRELHTNVGELPARSRILFARQGIEKVISIDATISKYGKYTARELVELTHKENSPWSHIDSSKRYQEITDELIKKYHYVECI